MTGQQTLIPLAGPANRQGRIAADNIAGRSSTFRGSQGSSVVGIFGLTLAGTGASLVAMWMQWVSFCAGLLGSMLAGQQSSRLRASCQIGCLQDRLLLGTSHTAHMPSDSYALVEATCIIGNGSAMFSPGLCAGASEKTLKRLSIPYRKVYIHAGHHAGYYPGAKTIDLKLLFSPEASYCFFC